MQLGEARDFAECLDLRVLRADVRGLRLGDGGSRLRAPRGRASASRPTRGRRGRRRSRGRRRARRRTPSRGTPRRPGSRTRTSRASGVDAFRSSQPYAVNATSEPKTIRKSSAPSDAAEICDGCTRPPSPLASPSTPSSAPAVSICIAAPANGPRGSGATRAYAEPAAHAKDAKSSTAAPSRSTLPEGPARIATPTRPVAMPATAPSGSRMPKHARSISGHEERNARDEQRRRPGRDALHRPGDTARVEHEERRADDRRRAPLAPAGPHGELAAPRREGVEERAGDEEAHGEHEERRQRPVGDGHARGTSIPRRRRRSRVPRRASCLQGASARELEQIGL